MEVNEIVQIKTIAVGNYTKRDGSASFFLYGLTFDGRVLRLDDRRDGWIPMPMRVANEMRSSVFNDEEDES